MNDWKKSNYAHWGTYRGLVVLNEIEATLVSFDEAKTYKMPGLSFFVLGAGSSDLEKRAELVAMGLYNFILANYSPDWQDRTKVDAIRKALDAMIAVLSDKDKSISDLAYSVDDIFKFSNE